MSAKPTAALAKLDRRFLFDLRVMYIRIYTYVTYLPLQRQTCAIRPPKAPLWGRTRRGDYSLSNAYQCTNSSAGLSSGFARAFKGKLRVRTHTHARIQTHTNGLAFFL
ncbi:hypothetical protein EVAR_45097_1 [Eumeta japonica]|uniref:Uncharacterized protein n=1 Tax=Eumeta variegata TaxID=151549 RepID=A0A4C1YFD4_EUMVA|nr:hypothetical protein EVAR_45097_1 [Eumeta japonica]